jgi:hypothetical protein
MADLRLAADPLPARLYSRGWRVVAGLLLALSRGSLPILLVLVVLASDPPIDLPALLQLVAALVLIPGLAARLVERSGAARLALSNTGLVVRRADLLMEVPYDALARVAPWVVPLPGPGLTVWLRSGRRLRYAIEMADPAPLIAALAAVVGEAARPALHHPSVIYAHAAAAAPPWRWYHYLWKFVLFALAPTAVLFNAHQYIAYGGTLGEYYLFGAAAYARTFALYWLTLAIYLVLFASLWRGVGEAAALFAAWAAPAQAAQARRIAERCCQLGYYGGVPALLALRFLA